MAGKQKNRRTDLRIPHKKEMWKVSFWVNLAEDRWEHLVSDKNLPEATKEQQQDIPTPAAAP